VVGGTQFIAIVGLRNLYVLRFEPIIYRTAPVSLPQFARLPVEILDKIIEAAVYTADLRSVELCNDFRELEEQQRLAKD
jgi:hypothetical protein